MKSREDHITNMTAATTRTSTATQTTHTHITDVCTVAVLAMQYYMCTICVTYSHSKHILFCVQSQSVIGEVSLMGSPFTGQELLWQPLG